MTTPTSQPRRRPVRFFVFWLSFALAAVASGWIQIENMGILLRDAYTDEPAPWLMLAAPALYGVVIALGEVRRPANIPRWFSRTLVLPLPVQLAVVLIALPLRYGDAVYGFSVSQDYRVTRRGASWVAPSWLPDLSATRQRSWQVSPDTC